MGRYDTNDDFQDTADYGDIQGVAPAPATQNRTSGVSGTDEFGNICNSFSRMKVVDVSTLAVPEWLRNALQSLDQDGDGLDQDEVEEVLRVAALQKKLDKEHGDEIFYKRFPESIQKIMEIWDTDGSGTICSTELAAAAAAQKKLEKEANMLKKAVGFLVGILVLLCVMNFVMAYLAAEAAKDFKPATVTAKTSDSRRRLKESDTDNPANYSVPPPDESHFNPVGVEEMGRDCPGGVCPPSHLAQADKSPTMIGASTTGFYTMPAATVSVQFGTVEYLKQTDAAMYDKTTQTTHNFVNFIHVMDKDCVVEARRRRLEKSDRKLAVSSDWQDVCGCHHQLSVWDNPGKSHYLHVGETVASARRRRHLLEETGDVSSHRVELGVAKVGKANHLHRPAARHLRLLSLHSEGGKNEKAGDWKNEETKGYVETFDGNTIRLEDNLGNVISETKAPPVDQSNFFAMLKSAASGANIHPPSDTTDIRQCASKMSPGTISAMVPEIIKSMPEETRADFFEELNNESVGAMDPDQVAALFDGVSPAGKAGLEQELGKDNGAKLLALAKGHAVQNLPADVVNGADPEGKIMRGMPATDRSGFSPQTIQASYDQCATAAKAHGTEVFRDCGVIPASASLAKHPIGSVVTADDGTRTGVANSGEINNFIHAREQEQERGQQHEDMVKSAVAAFMPMNGDMAAADIESVVNMADEAIACVENHGVEEDLPPSGEGFDTAFGIMQITNGPAGNCIQDVLDYHAHYDDVSDEVPAVTAAKLVKHIGEGFHKNAEAGIAAPPGNVATPRRRLKRTTRKSILQAAAREKHRGKRDFGRNVTR